MTPITKKYLITTEKHELRIVRQNDHATLQAFCAECGTVVEILNFDSATTKSNIRTREIFRLVETGKIHSIETENGHLLICKKSLFERKNI